MWRLMGSDFHEWTDYSGVAFSIEFLEWDRTFSDFLACSKRSDSGERCEVKRAMKSRGGLGREVMGTLVRIVNKSAFRYTRSWYTL